MGFRISGEVGFRDDRGQENLSSISFVTMAASEGEARDELVKYLEKSNSYPKSITILPSALSHPTQTVRTPIITGPATASPSVGDFGSKDFEFLMTQRLTIKEW